MFKKLVVLFLVLLATDSFALTSYQIKLAQRNAAAQALTPVVYVAPTPVPVYVPSVPVIPTSCPAFYTGMTYGEQLAVRQCLALQNTPVPVDTTLLDAVVAPVVDITLP